MGPGGCRGSQTTRFDFYLRERSPRGAGGRGKPLVRRWCHPGHGLQDRIIQEHSLASFVLAGRWGGRQEMQKLEDAGRSLWPRDSPAHPTPHSLTPKVRGSAAGGGWWVTQGSLTPAALGLCQVGQAPPPALGSTSPPAAADTRVGDTATSLAVPAPSPGSRSPQSPLRGGSILPDGEISSPPAGALCFPREAGAPGPPADFTDRGGNRERLGRRRIAFLRLMGAESLNGSPETAALQQRRERHRGKDIS